MTDIESKMSELAARFASRAVAEREAFMASLASGNRTKIVEHAHKLAGVAGMYGYPMITEAALALEEAAEQGRAMDASARRLLDLLLDLETS